MMFSTTELIEDLIERTRLNINRVEEYRELSEKKLNFRPQAGKWSTLECLEHLNLYGDFYIPAIKDCMNTENSTPSDTFKSGIIGNYFVNAISPKNAKKMKTATDKNPIGSSLDKSVIDKFIDQQKEYLELINQSNSINLQKAKTAISISKLIKLRLGDTFRFIIAHNDRHLNQIENIFKKASK